MMISVCVATYNGEDFILEQINSILSQLSPTDEVVISDNCSTDATVQIIRSLNDERIRLYSFSPGNLVRNFENGLTKCAGDVIFLSDQDDVWLPGRVKRMLAELAVHDVVVADCRVVDASLTTVRESLFAVLRPQSGLVRNLMRNSYIGCCMAFKRPVLDAALPFPAKLPMHDWWIGLVGEMVGLATFIHEPLLLYRRHGNNASPTSGKSANSLVKKLAMRFLLAKNIWRRFG